MLKTIKLFPDDILPDTLYGAVFAHFRLDNLDKATTALEHAIGYSPNIAKELIKKNHKKIDPDRSITVGGEDEALDYWERIGLFWTDPKLIKFVENGLKNQKK